MEVDNLGFPVWTSDRRRFKPNDPFFADGNVERELLAKHVALDLTSEEKYQLENMGDEDDQIVICPIAGCAAQLNSLDAFEDHYHTRHTASCSVCSRVFPTSRLLSIHVSEAHDSFFQAKVARGFPMYECLVEGCGIKLKSYKSRQQHLVDKHKFPASFEFFKQARPSKKDRQKLHHKQAYNQKDDMECTDYNGKESLKPQQPKYRQKKPEYKKEEVKETDMEVEEKIDELTSAVSKLRTSDSTPASISFGHRHTRGLTFLPRSVQRNKKHVPAKGAAETK